MTAMAHTEARHVVSRGVASLSEQVAGLAEASLWSMSPAETEQTLVALTRLTSQIGELELRVAEHAASVGVGDAQGATSTAAWWAHATRQTRLEAHRKMRLALGLERFPLVRDGLVAGDLTLEQASVIVRALGELNPDLDYDVRAQAQARLVVLAREHDAKSLRILGRRILDVLDPVAADEAEAKKLAAEDAKAAATARFTMSEDGHGRVHGRFTIPAAQGAMLKKILLALAAPKHLAATQGAGVERVPGPQRMGRAFGEFIERYPTEKVPAAGGVNASVVITMDLATLLGGLKAASLDTGERISADQARRLACEAGIIPAVLGGASQVLDLGRKRRFHTTSQRIALALEQGGCTAQGCDWPPGMCHAHHDTPWSRGGPTSVRQGRLLCPRHHARAHDPTYEMTKLPGGKVAFTRRT